MRRAVAAALLVAASLSSSAPATPASSPRGWTRIPRPPLPQFDIPRPLRVTLENGMTLLLLEDHELPLVHAVAMVHAGSATEPADKAGLGEMIGEAWRTGGTRGRSGDELDDSLDARGARVETWVDTTSAGISLSCLTAHLDGALAALVELLREPEFAPDKVELARTHVETEIARRNDDPDEIASRESRRLVYGAESPYARVPERSTIARVTRADCLAWHSRYVHPDRALLGVVGDFDARALEATLRRLLGGWPRGPSVPDAEPAYDRAARPGVYLVAKEDVNQSSIRLAHLGTTRRDPDYYALEVMNQLFGGGSSSRLTREVRTRRGLAYMVWGGVESEYDHPGMFEIASGTRSGATAAAIRALVGEVERLVREPPTARELATAKSALVNSFVFRVDSKEKVLRQRLRAEYFGYPPDWLERYRAGIERITAEDVSRAAGKHVRKGDLAILVVGNPRDFDAPLTEFGKVETLDVTIPQR